MIERIHHLGLAVTDLAAAVTTYTALGGTVVGKGRIEGEDTDYVLVRADEVELELLHSDDAQSPVGRFLVRRGQGVHHVAYRVRDVARSAQALSAQGYELVGEPRTGVHGSRVVFVHPRSMQGVLTELVEATDERGG